MSNIDKQVLRTAAENATPGEWCTDDYHGVIADAGLNANYYIASCSGPDNRSNKRFIAAANPTTVLALLDELEAAEKRIAELPGRKRLIGWRMADYTDETADPALAKNWATAVDVLPIFEGDVNTKLSTAAAGKGE
ncbi:ead/Ea22-like family protein [Enterobacter kobei]|nr:ead/Ea22-like family protein [Enterobacter kobei]